MDRIKEVWSIEINQEAGIQENGIRECCILQVIGLDTGLVIDHVDSVYSFKDFHHSLVRINSLIANSMPFVHRCI